MICSGIAQILKREGTNYRAMSKILLTVVQALLLYGSESWVISDNNMRKLEYFYRRAVMNMNVTHKLEYPDYRTLLLVCGVFPMKTYIQRRRGTLRKYLEENRGELMEKDGKLRRHCKDVNKILWW